MSPDEFTRIVSETKGIVLKAIADHLPADQYDAIDDIAQETWLKAYSALARNTFAGRSRLSTWLYTIARNETLRHLKKAQREEWKKSRIKLAQEPTILPDDTAAMIVEENSFLDRLNRGLKLLNKRQQSIVQLKLSGMTDAETARELQISPGTVKSAFARSKEKLARFFCSHHTEHIKR